MQRRRHLARAAAGTLGFGALLLLGGAASADPGAAATRPTHVAIVIAGHGVACVAAGATGDDILNSVAQVAYRPSDHLIWQIDEQPSPAHADATHYWSYWHDDGRGWRYSSTGASGYTPAAGTVEGWAYDNGSSAAPPPPSVSYAAACGSRDPQPVPSSTHRSVPPRPHPVSTTTSRPPVAGRHGVAVPPRAAGSAPAGSATAATGPGPSSARHRATRSSGVVSSSPAAAAPAPTSLGASPVGRAGLLTPLAAPGRHQGGSVAPTVLALGLAAIVVAGAGWAAVRRRRAG